MPNPKIYVVDDDQDDRLFLTGAIAAVLNPIEIIELSDGNEFIERIREETVVRAPMVVLLDMNMPKLNGLEVLEALQFDRKLKDIIVIMVSTSANETLMSEAYRLGVTKYYIKPFEIAEYEKMIEEINETFIRNTSK